MLQHILTPETGRINPQLSFNFTPKLSDRPLIPPIKWRNNCQNRWGGLPQLDLYMLLQQCKELLMNRGVPARKQPWLQSVPTKFRPAKTNHVMILWDHINGVALTTCSQNVPKMFPTVSGSVANVLCQSTCIFEDVLYWFNGSNMVKHIGPEKVVCFSSQKSSAFWCWTHAREPRSSLCSSPSNRLWEWMTTRHGETARHGSFHGAYIIQHKSPMEISSLLLQEKHDHNLSVSLFLWGSQVLLVQRADHRLRLHIYRFQWQVSYNSDWDIPSSSHLSSFP